MKYRFRRKTYSCSGKAEQLFIKFHEIETDEDLIQAGLDDNAMYPLFVCIHNLCQCGKTETNLWQSVQWLQRNGCRIEPDEGIYVITIEE